VEETDRLAGDCAVEDVDSLDAEEDEIGRPSRRRRSGMSDEPACFALEIALDGPVELPCAFTPPAVAVSADEPEAGVYEAEFRLLLFLLLLLLLWR
jgi:hypothetical protein